MKLKLVKIGKKPTFNKKIFDKKIGEEISSLTSAINDDFLMSPQNAATYLDVSVKFVYELIQSKKIKSFHVGTKLRRIRKKTLDDWLNLQAMKFER
jgi:excisionase family DNA binding protein